MTRPRKELISLADTPYYHIVSRCVRRAFLCGVDQHKQTNYEHRRLWVEERLRLLSSLFAIDLCAYAVMSNHYHLVVKLDSAQAETWNDQEVVNRWTLLFKGPLLIQKQQQKQPLSPAEQDTVKDIIQVWRHRLCDLGWFMKCLNEPIAREANKEDKCTGHFWEGRYKSQALLTEAALLSCMAYVDLNPIRAYMAKTPETSDHTSIKARIDLLRKKAQTPANNTPPAPIKPLLKFDGNLKNEKQTGLPFALLDYIELVDWTGRIVREDKRGAIHKHTPPILERLAIDTPSWLKNSTAFETYYRNKRKTKTLASTG